jgi:hypothetical protein
MAAPIKAWVLLATQKKTHVSGKIIGIQIVLRQLFKGSENYGVHLKCCSLALCCARKRRLHFVHGGSDKCR